ncbi:MAG: Na+/H+ antiporter subunit B [Desulfobacteraceae bacterium]|jgi:multisubunit Na+/H+ antiporter MnhB subunit|nr:Na+/H+ antiporter subunit B [Desulfobacteraceae bacterium]
MPSLILKTATRLLVGLILTFSVYLLMRGHNAPGGGFAAALVAGTGFALFAIAEGPTVVRGAIRIAPQTIVMIGLSLALVSALTALVVGRPFFTGIWWIRQNGQTPSLAIGTPLFFDLGVFLAVLGTILTLILALEEN